MAATQGRIDQVVVDGQVHAADWLQTVMRNSIKDQPIAVGADARLAVIVNGQSVRVAIQDAQGHCLVSAELR